jgi:hypothetical protein
MIDVIPEGIRKLFLSVVEASGKSGKRTGAAENQYQN